MLILAIDTTTRSGSIALARDEQVLAVVSGDASKTHAERLPADIAALLAEQRTQVADVDVFGVAAGPGSFTGLRIGIATVQGLAFAMNRLVVPVSTLDALAQVASQAASAAHTEPHLVAAFMDAQRSEVFAALYRIVGAQSPLAGFETIDGPVSQPPAIVLNRWRDIGDSTDAIWIAGDGLARYLDLVTERLGPRARPVDPRPPLAPTIARIAAREAAAGRAVAPHAIKPVYVRRPDAELARDRNPLPKVSPDGP